MMCDDDEEQVQYLYSFICPECGQEVYKWKMKQWKTNKVLVCPKCGNSIPVGTLDVDELSF